MKGDQTPVKDLLESELLESIPELIDLREEGEKPIPFPLPESPMSHHAETASSLFFPT